MTLAERIHENERRERLEIRLQAIHEGEIKGKIKTTRKMLGLKLDDKIIQEVTGLKKKELEKIKKELAETKS